MSPEKENSTPPVTHQVEVINRIQAEIGTSVRAIRPVNVEIITEIAATLEKLRPYITDTALLDDTVAAAHELEKGRLTPDAFNNVWMAVLIGLSLIFAQHFASSAGDVLGKSAAQELIRALARLLN